MEYATLTKRTTSFTSLMANITLFAQATNKLPKENIRKIIRDSKTDFGQQAVWQRAKFRFRMPIKLLDSPILSYRSD